jgi:putative (di)nucleoside polyphosphate hydrolase
MQRSWMIARGEPYFDGTCRLDQRREIAQRAPIDLALEVHDVLGVTPGWLRYRLPPRAIRRHERLVCIGQKQVWFLLQFTGAEADLRLDHTDHPEFDQWRWVDFWYPAENVVLFKRGVYCSALRHLAPFARQIAGAQAIPPPLPHLAREQSHRGRPQSRRPRPMPVPTRGDDGSDQAN